MGAAALAAAALLELRLADRHPHHLPGNLGEDRSVLTRWRDFVDAGLHVASATDSAWIFPELALTETSGRLFGSSPPSSAGRPCTAPSLTSALRTVALPLEPGRNSDCCVSEEPCLRRHLPPAGRRLRDGERRVQAMTGRLRPAAYDPAAMRNAAMRDVV